MADQPQTANASRITAMLQDLAAQKEGGSVPATPRLTPPPNLPTAPARGVPPPPAGVAPAPRPSAPPPAPREPLVSVAPIPKPPVPPPPPKAPPPPVAPPPPIAPRIAPPVTPLKPASAQVSTELRTMSADIGNLRVGQSPQGIRPPSTVVPVPGVPPIPATRPIVPPISQPAIIVQSAPPSVIVIPPTSGTGMGRKILYAILGMVIIGGIIYSLFALLSGSGTEPSPTTTPSASTTPIATLGAKTLVSYFGNPIASLDLSDSATAWNDFRNGIITIQPTAKLAGSIAMTSNGTSMSNTVFLSYLLGTPPSSLTDVLGSEWVLLDYGQTEQFDASGIKTESPTARSKIILILEVTNVSEANQALRTWEDTGLASASAILLDYNTTNKIVSGFTEGVYRTIPVRYWNFPYADSSIDYGIVTASNNTNYLILSASRESMFFAIDQLMQ